MKTLPKIVIATFISALLLTPVVVMGNYQVPTPDRPPVGAIPTGTGVNQTTGLIGVISQVVRFALGFLGVVIFLLFLYAGFQYATAAGDSDKTKEATDTMRNAVIGLIIIFISFAAVNAILEFVFPGAN
jgi:hypothetical protein